MKRLRADSIGHRLKITKSGIERQVVDGPIRQAATSAVVSGQERRQLL
jgi:hypothetical protein